MKGHHIVEKRRKLSRRQENSKLAVRWESKLITYSIQIIAEETNSPSKLIINGIFTKIYKNVTTNYWTKKEGLTNFKNWYHFL